MKLGTSFVLFAVVSATNGEIFSSTPADRAKNICQEPEPKTCVFYDKCLDVAHPCGQNGYATKFGGAHCQQFMIDHDTFSPQGKDWVYNSMNCLQRQLVPLLRNKSLTCDEVENAAFATYPGCYANNGGPSICDLPWSDWRKIAKIVGTNILIQVDQAFRKQGLVDKSCYKAWLH
jgi:hypothetical protein